MQLPLCELPEGGGGSWQQTQLTQDLPPVPRPPTGRPSGLWWPVGPRVLLTLHLMVLLLMGLGHSDPGAVTALVILAPRVGIHLPGGQELQPFQVGALGCCLLVAAGLRGEGKGGEDPPLPGPLPGHTLEGRSTS